MAKRESVVRAVASLVRANGLLVGAVACAVGWAFLARFSGLLFGPDATVAQSGTMSIAVLATLLVGVVAVPPLRSVRGALWAARFSGLLFGPDATVAQSGTMSIAVLATLLVGVVAVPPLRSVRGALWAAAVGGLGALAATLALTLDPLRGGLGPLAYLVGGVLQGCSYLASAQLALGVYRRLGFKTSLVVAAVSCTAALGLYVLACGLLPRGLAWLAASLPVLSAVFAVAAVRRHPAEKTLEAQAALPAASVRPAALGALLVLAGLLAVYMPVMYPKTTNIAARFLAASECLGLASWGCVAALALFVGLLWLGVAIVYRQRAAMTAAVLCSMVLVASIFFMLPSMGTSAVAFVLFVACGLIAVLFAVALLVRCAPQGAGKGSLSLRGGLAVAAGGGLVAAVFAFVFLGPLYNATAFQDTLFSVVPAVLLLGYAGVLFGLRRPVAEALGAWGGRRPSRDVGARG